MSVDDILNLAFQSHQLGRLDDADRLYRQVLAQNPNHADALHLLGGLAQQSGRLDIAEELIRRAIEVNPQREDFHLNLGGVLTIRGDYSGAMLSYTLASKLKPESPAVWYNLGVAFANQNCMEAAVINFRKSLAISPNQVECQNNLAVAVGNMGYLEESMDASRKALALNPNFAKAHNNLGNMLLLAGRVEEAIEAFRRALASASDYAIAHSNLIFAMNFHPAYDSASILREARQWDEQHGKPCRHLMRPHANHRDKNRRLKVGYVSADFREHVVGWYILSLLRHHDREQVEIFCYSGVRITDLIHGQLRVQANHWRDVAHLSDESLAAQIRDDGIDVLIDLSLHSAKNRLGVFAMVPAPVQITYLGYCGTSGIEGIHYRFSDPHLDPPDADLSCYSERTIRLPESYWCYAPGGETQAVSQLPADKNGIICFGCLNQFAKISQPTLESWCEILNRVTRSRLLIHAPSGKHRQTVIDRMAKRGIAPDRIEFIDRESWNSYIHTYNRIDIGLDPFPYNGGVTTCDALWMGVPVISLSGRTPVGRGGRSILGNIGLSDLLAYSPEQYVELAVTLAGDLPRLTELRKTLRERMQSSTLMDAARFARNVEAAYRDAWRRWCDKP